MDIIFIFYQHYYLLDVNLANMEGVGVRVNLHLVRQLGQEPISETSKQGTERLANGAEICLDSTPSFSRQHAVSFKR